MNYQEEHNEQITVNTTSIFDFYICIYKPKTSYTVTIWYIGICMFIQYHTHTHTKPKPNPFNLTSLDRHGQAAQERSKSWITPFPEARPAPPWMSLSGCLWERTQVCRQGPRVTLMQRKFGGVFFPIAPHSVRSLGRDLFSFYLSLLRPSSSLCRTHTHWQPTGSHINRHTHAHTVHAHTHTGLTFSW